MCLDTHLALECPERILECLYCKDQCLFRDLEVTTGLEWLSGHAIGGFIMTSLHNCLHFCSLAYELTHRICSRIYVCQLGSKIKRAG